MFRKPNTPGRKRAWEIDTSAEPSSLPPAWLNERYGAFEDMENNAVFRYVRVFRKLPKERLEDLRLTAIQPREVVEGYIAAMNTPDQPWFRRSGVQGAMTELDVIVGDSEDRRIGGSRFSAVFPALITFGPFFCWQLLSAPATRRGIMLMFYIPALVIPSLIVIALGHYPLKPAIFENRIRHLAIRTSFITHRWEL